NHGREVGAPGVLSFQSQVRTAIRSVPTHRDEFVVCREWTLRTALRYVNPVIVRREVNRTESLPGSNDRCVSTAGRYPHEVRCLHAVSPLVRLDGGLKTGGTQAGNAGTIGRPGKRPEVGRRGREL